MTLARRMWLASAALALLVGAAFTALILAVSAQRDATEREGRFGTELVCELSVQTPEGRAASQSSRIIGINGPRWMLRGTFLGRPATDFDNAGGWEDTLAKVAIRRGDHAMPAGAPLPVVLPESARRAAPDQP